jgi:hypothetical protein
MTGQRRRQRPRRRCCGDADEALRPLRERHLSLHSSRGPSAGEIGRLHNRTGVCVGRLDGARRVFVRGRKNEEREEGAPSSQKLFCASAHAEGLIVSDRERERDIEDCGLMRAREVCGP